MYKACIVILNDREYTGEEKDSVGRKIEDYIKRNNFDILLYKIMPEVKSIYKEFLIKCCDEYGVDFLITIGSKCLSEEVIQEVVERRDAKLDIGIRKKTIIKNCKESVTEKDIELVGVVENIKKL